MESAHQQSRREQMFAHIAAWEESGQTQKKYCQEIGENYGVFQYWLRKYRRKDSLQEGGFDELIAAGSSPHLEIVYPSGVKLRLPTGTDPRLVRTYLGY